MSAAVQPSRSSLPARMHHRRNRLNSLEALERGFSLFRSTFAQESWRYYLGSAPIVFCFIPVWVMDGQIRLSDGIVVIEAAMLALCYLLRACMVASYMQKVRERAFGAPTAKPTGIIGRVAAIARLLAWKIPLSAGALVTLPTVAGAPWFYGASQFASFAAREDGTEKHSLAGCLGLAGQWFGSSLLLFLMLFPFWIVVWLNGLIIAMVVPQLLHSILGVNTILSTPVGIFALVRSSAFWLSLFAGAWLALDPIVKCSFVIVYQHLRSRREGDDLRALLAALPREQQKKAELIASSADTRRVAGALVILAAILLGLGISQEARAGSLQAAPNSAEAVNDSARQARIQHLREAMAVESERAVYRWHDAEHPSPPNWFDKLLAKIGRRLERAWDALLNFLRKLWPRGGSLGNDQARPWQLKDIRLWLWLIAILTLAAGGVLFWLRRKEETALLSIPPTIAPLPDLSESELADVRSEEEWFALAGQLEGQGELRFALRAAYLGLLAGLAQREWLTIRRDRTNREYLDEFTRRWRRRPQASVEVRAEIPEQLRGSLRQFDRVWYGFHVVTPGAVATYRKQQRELLNHV